MIKLSFCLRRLPHLSREEFQRYWFDTHGPLVRKHAEALRIQRYVQTHTLLGDAADSLRATRGGPPATTAWPSCGGTARRTSPPRLTPPAAREAGRILLEDERKFIDLANSPLFWAREREIIARR